MQTLQKVQTNAGDQFCVRTTDATPTNLANLIPPAGKTFSYDLMVIGKKVDSTDRYIDKTTVYGVKDGSVLAMNNTSPEIIVNDLGLDTETAISFSVTSIGDALTPIVTGKVGMLIDWVIQVINIVEA